MDFIYEKVEKHDVLNPKLFDENNKLREPVRAKIEDIVDLFLEGLDEDGISFDLNDIVLVGSNCSYNYNDDSDLDIHLIADTKSLKCPEELYSKLYDAYKSLFNKKYDINFYGIPVEIYVELDGLNRVSNGVYSVMNNEWVKEPVAEDIPEVDEEKLEKEIQKWEDRYNEIMRESEISLDEEIENPMVDKIDSYRDDIHELRKQSLATEGEYGIGNLVFKEIRNKGYLDNLKELKNKIVGDELSLKENFENLNEELSYYWESNDGEGPFDDFEECQEKARKYNLRVEWDPIPNTPLPKSNPQYTRGYKIIGDREDLIKFISDYYNRDQLEYVDPYTEALEEATKKIKDGKWVNKGKEGTHGAFKTKKEADAQRKAMFANGYHEGLNEDLQELDSEGNVLSPEQIELFKDSKIRDKQGRLLVCSHSSNKENIDIFDENSFGSNEGSVWGDGFYFYNHSNNHAFGKNSYNCYLNIVNPFPRYDKEAFKDVLIRNYPEADVEDYLQFREENLYEYKDTEILEMYVYQTYGDKINFRELCLNAEYDGIIVPPVIVAFKPNQIKSIDNRNPSNSDNINERLDDLKRYKYRDEIARISFNQPIIQDNGLFNIYNVKEDDADRIINRIRSLDYIEYVNKVAGGKYDFSKFVMPGKLPSKYYTINGKIKEDK